MKVLVFHIGLDRYGLALAGINRVLPVVALKHIPLAPPFVAGLMDLGGEPVPVIDLSRLAGLAPEHVWFDTRIILVDYPLASATTACLGLLAEHVTGVEALDPGALREPGVDGAPFLGRVAGSSAGMLQLVRLDQLLTPAVRALLFPAQVHT
jgi:chemotaxis-related protein WspB